MLKPFDILRISNQPEIDPSMDLLYEKERHIPGSIQYSIKGILPIINGPERIPV